MGLLQSFKRPLVAFNPATKEHRQLYSQFLKTGTWGSCPYSFHIPNDEAADNNLAYAMQRMLTEFYVNKEFV